MREQWQTASSPKGKARRWLIGATIAAASANLQATLLHQIVPIDITIPISGATSWQTVSTSMALDLFDPALGTLWGVTWSLEVTGSWEGRVVGNNPGAGPYHHEASGVARVDLFSSIPTPSRPDQWLGSHFVYLGATCDTDLVAPVCEALGSSYSSSNLLLDDPPFSEAVGPGALSITTQWSWEMLTGLRLPDGGAGDDGFSDVEGQVRLIGAGIWTYRYTAPGEVPEPATLALMALAIAGMGRSLRRDV